ETLLFRYREGQIFATRLWQEGGWQAVNAAYRNPPQSSEQILHPEKYTQNRDEPTAVTVPDISRSLGAGWKRLDENTFGEFQVRVMLSASSESERASAAAAGWDGDRYQLWTRGDEDALVWQSVWDSERDADDFAAALAGYDERRFDARFTESDASRVLITADRAVQLRVAGREVTYVQAPTKQLAASVVAAASGE
ncbi:MAG: hypothetical protein M3281_06615, partial [Chloroflexota bacterium]|nr:hypothetical protein [Chloroflexota bacterium]